MRWFKMTADVIVLTLTQVLWNPRFCTRLARGSRPPTHKSVFIGHFDRRKGLGVKHCIFWDHSVYRQQVRSDGIHLVIGQRLRSRIRHGTADVIENRSSAGPVANRSLNGLARRERSHASRELILWLARALRAMAALALLSENSPSGRHGPAAGWESSAIRSHRDIQLANFLRRERAAESRRLRLQC